MALRQICDIAAVSAMDRGWKCTDRRWDSVRVSNRKLAIDPMARLSRRHLGETTGLALIRGLILSAATMASRPAGGLAPTIPAAVDNGPGRSVPPDAR